MKIRIVKNLWERPTEHGIIIPIDKRTNLPRKGKWVNKIWTPENPASK